ncbi:MAG: lysylphosphatidylglycerol synthase transmembrane domain-containing protein [Gemmatimonadaceae bacterium]
MNFASPRTRQLLQAGTWIFATFLIVVLARSVDVGRVWALAQDVHGSWIAAAIASNLVILPLWAQQWRSLLPPSSDLSPKRMLSIATQLAFLGNAVPGSGPVSAVVLLGREPGVTHTAALSALALEQTTEGVTKVTVLLIAAQVLPLPDWMHRALLALAIAVGVLTVVVAIASRWARDLESLKHPSRLAIALVCCFGTKAAEALAIVAVQQAFAQTLPLSTTILVLAAAILGSIAPLSPANVGIYEGAVIAAYRHTGVAPELALAMAVIQHACLLLGTAAVGYVVFSVKRFTAARAAG